MNFHSPSVIEDILAVALIPCNETRKQEKIEIEIERVKRRVYSVKVSIRDTQVFIEDKKS